MTEEETARDLAEINLACRLEEVLRRIDALETRVSFIVSYLPVNIQIALNEEEWRKAKPKEEMC